MLAIFALLTYNQTAYMHSHIQADGTVVAHAHPYDKSTDSEPIKSHHHTRLELIVISHFSLLFWVAFIAFVLSLNIKTTFICKCSFHHYKEDLVFVLPGRAPPAFS